MIAMLRGDALCLGHQATGAGGAGEVVEQAVVASARASISGAVVAGTTTKRSWIRR
jgi:hypothetical protein